MVITPIYAAVLVFLFVFLAIRVILGRRSARVGLGDGGDDILLRRMRVHANFTEYAPLCLLLMCFMELQGKPDWALHIVGGLLLLGRFGHAYGVSQSPENISWRVFGMALTFTALLLGALAGLIPF